MLPDPTDPDRALANLLERDQALYVDGTRTIDDIAEELAAHLGCSGDPIGY
ncbi:MAG: hypothetical protein WCC38_13035 [Pseudonocardiaceae bacterium]